MASDKIFKDLSEEVLKIWTSLDFRIKFSVRKLKICKQLFLYSLEFLVTFDQAKVTEVLLENSLKNFLKISSKSQNKF